MWAPLGKLFTPPGVPRWLRACVRYQHVAYRTQYEMTGSSQVRHFTITSPNHSVSLHTAHNIR